MAQSVSVGHSMSEKESLQLETYRAARRIKAGKAPGACGIYPEYIRYGGHTALSALNELFVQVWEEETVPYE